jgi:hypothetical protein
VEIWIEGHRVYDWPRKHTQTINICEQGKPRGQQNCIYVIQFQRPFVSTDELRAKEAEKPTLLEFLIWLTGKGGRKRPVTTKALSVITGTRKDSECHSGSPPQQPSEPKQGSEDAEDDPLIDPNYLPFTIDRFRKHFAPIVGDDQETEDDRHLRYYLSSADRYDKFQAEHPSRRGLPIASMRYACQIEKDERFWTAGCFLKFYYSDDPIGYFSTLLSKCFRQLPPIGLPSWEHCLGEPHDLEIYFEANLPAPVHYKQWLCETVESQHIIPYVRDAAYRLGCDVIRRNLEGPTHVDALLLNKKSGFSVLFEAKVLSDISSQVSFDVMRNQVVRCVDVMLDKNPNLAEPLDRRDPDRSLFVLLTPKIFKENSHTRLYGWLMNSYMNKPEMLKRDMPHRGEEIDWANLSERLGWLTWEDCEEVLPGSCTWLRD